MHWMKTPEDLGSKGATKLAASVSGIKDWLETTKWCPNPCQLEDLKIQLWNLRHATEALEHYVCWKEHELHNMYGPTQKVITQVCTPVVTSPLVCPSPKPVCAPYNPPSPVFCGKPATYTPVYSQKQTACSPRPETVCYEQQVPVYEQSCSQSKGVYTQPRSACGQARPIPTQSRQICNQTKPILSRNSGLNERDSYVGSRLIGERRSTLAQAPVFEEY